MNANTASSMTREKEGWLVRVRLAGGQMQEVRCATEDQARYFAAMLALSPKQSPKLRN